MNHKYYNTKRKKGKHLTLVERGKIELLLKQQKTNQEIANIIGVSKRTIIREKKRGLVVGLRNSDWSTRDEYSAERAQCNYEHNQKNKQGFIKIDKNHKLAQFLENTIIRNKFSPYAALVLAKQKGYFVNISLKTLYNYIHKEIFLSLTKKHLPYFRKEKKLEIQPKRIRKNGGRSIEERDEAINNREELGHWEMDTVLGKRSKGACLLVLTERKSRKQIIEKIARKDSKSVIEGLDRILNRYPKTKGERFLTITSDNGAEFMDAAAIERRGIIHFYAHSYCSWERGSNENNNKLIRRFISKGKNISEVSKKEIKEIEKWLNRYPRKIFNGKSSEEIYERYLTKK